MTVEGIACYTVNEVGAHKPSVMGITVFFYTSYKLRILMLPQYVVPVNPLIYKGVYSGIIRIYLASAFYRERASYKNTIFCTSSAHYNGGARARELVVRGALALL